MESKILTLHPTEGKVGRNISLAKYKAIQGSLLRALKGGTLLRQQLLSQVQLDLSSNFEGALAWYFETVQLDLEARGAIIRIREGGRLLFQLGDTRVVEPSPEVE